LSFAVQATVGAPVSVQKGVAVTTVGLGGVRSLGAEPQSGKRPFSLSEDTFVPFASMEDIACTIPSM